MNDPAKTAAVDGKQCAACRAIGSAARCNACPRTPWEEYATSEDGVREYAMAEKPETTAVDDARKEARDV